MLARNFKGFTLIELLVTVTIVGVLSAIALPNFLNSIEKAKATEAKSNLGILNRAQQVYRFEKNSFASDLSTLSVDGANISGKYYQYSVNGETDTATAFADPGTLDLKVYASGVVQRPDQTSTQIICESLQVKGSGVNNAAAVSLTIGPPASASCLSGRKVE
jgi:type IV pilus assembly protein PilA